MKRYVKIDISDEGAVVLDSKVYTDFQYVLDESISYLDEHNTPYSISFMNEEEFEAYQNRECDAG